MRQHHRIRFQGSAARMVAVSGRALVLMALALAVHLEGVEPVPPGARTGAPKPTWATADGDDAFGHWADLVASGVRQRMRWIVPGTFTMGSLPTATDSDKRETPHLVTLTTGYWLAESECTQELWMAVSGANPSQFTGDGQRPVERVNVEDVQRFCAQLNEQTHQHCFALPTEAQWEYACRAGVSGTDAPADPPLAEFGWYGGNSGGISHAVKQKRPNAWGLYDMRGNVCEWCADWLWDYPQDAVTDPLATTAALVRVIRGGNWDNEPRSCRPTGRAGVAPECRVGIVGFRLMALASGP